MSTRTMHTKKRTLRWLWLGLTLAAGWNMAARSSHAQSLWQHRTPDRVFLYTDTSARRVGDLLTVLIRENTDVENRDQRALGKDTDTGFNFDFASSSSASTPANANLETSAQSNREFNGSSQYSVEQQFTDRLTVQVIDILPNGNLVIAGKRRRSVSGEERTLVVSGVVRPIDISPNNTVPSQYIANFRVCYEGHGAETQFSNQGWAGRLINRVWPF